MLLKNKVFRERETVGTYFSWKSAKASLKNRHVSQVRPRGRMKLNKELEEGPCDQKEEHGHRPRSRRELIENNYKQPVCEQGSKRGAGGGLGHMQEGAYERFSQRF